MCWLHISCSSDISADCGPAYLFRQSERTEWLLTDIKQLQSFAMFDLMIIHINNRILLMSLVALNLGRRYSSITYILVQLVTSISVVLISNCAHSISHSGFSFTFSICSTNIETPTKLVLTERDFMLLFIRSGTTYIYSLLTCFWTQ